MGLTHVTVKLHSMNGAGAEYEADFLVDTGASDSMAPAPALERAGFRPVGSMSYEPADGTIREYSFGLAVIEFMGEVTAGRIIFGPPEAEPILGVTALESVGILVDPASKTLRRLPAVPLKKARASARGATSMVKIVYWQEDEAWLGYLQEYPDYWTQGETLEDLEEHLRDLYREVTSGAIPGVRRVRELAVS